jgi:hypothetical protein
MADTKISALTAASTPLAGTEVLPIVQSGVTKKVSVADLTTGRAISATQLTLSTGNLIVASGQGVDFSATPGTGTSELLADYEEGTWTPNFSSWSTSPTLDFASYTKVGRQVTINLVAAGGICAAGASIGNLPFAASAVAGASVLATASSNTSVFTAVVFNNTSSIGSLSGAAISGLTFWALSCTYFA